MEDFNTIIINLLNTISSELKDIKNAISTPKIVEIILSVSITSVFTLLGVFIGNVISQNNEKKKFKWNCYIKYLSCLYRFYIEIDKIITYLEDLEKIPAFMLKEPNDFVRFTNKKDFYAVREDVLDLRKTMLGLNIDRLKDEKFLLYKKEYIRKANFIINFDLISTISMNFSMHISQYHYYIPEKIWVEGVTINKELLNARKNEMRQFNILKYEKKLKRFIKKVEEELDSYGIKNIKKRKQ